VPIKRAGWHMVASPPWWAANDETFYFFLCKQGRERVLCAVALDVLEHAVQSSDLSEPTLLRIFEAHRLMIELGAAQKLSAGLLDSNGRVLVGVGDI
jgi:hypothetical protein